MSCTSVTQPLYFTTNEETCQKKIEQQNMTDSTAQTRSAEPSSRKLGHGYSLAIKTRSNTHCTLVYFHNCKRGYSQDLVKSMAEEYFRLNNLTTIDLVISEHDTFNGRSVLVKGEILGVVHDLAEVFAGFDIDHKPQTAHIDLRGNPLSNLTTKNVPLIGNWLH
mmetsp:Transcript_32075/g.66963  ORF Transcript_32075/g.66963 Transcript_32075/m.66963 type:complete len:164 (-) Transcript_32075:448-939(-)